MKLKNSYILLAVMAIFLLISIGSVCASEDATVDSYLADDGSDVVSANESSTDAEDTAQKIDTNIISNDVKVRDSDNKTIDVVVKDNESKTIENISNKNFTVTENNKTIGFSYNNSQITITDKLSLGKHSLIINYLGNEIYKNSTKNILLSIFGNYTIFSADSVNVNSTKIVEVPLNISNGVDNRPVNGEFNVSISYKNGNASETVNITSFKYENGKLIFDYPLLDNISSSTLALVYTEGEDKFTKNITLNKIINAKIEVINSVNEYHDGNFSFRLVDVDADNAPLANKTISLYTTGNIRAGFSAKTDDNGIAIFKTANLYEFDQVSSSLDMKQLGVGNHTVELSTASPIISEKVTVNLTINKATINIKIDKFNEKYGTDKNVTITVTNAKSGLAVSGIILHLNMPQTSGKDYYFQTDANGQSKISVKQLIAGVYDITLSNNDTANINKKEVDGTITIGSAITISAKDVTVEFNSGNTATITVKDKSTKKAVSGAILAVVLDKNNKKTFLVQTNSKGQATFSASLAVGKHSMSISNADARYYGSSVTKTITVKKASAKLSAPKVTAYYKQGKYFTITLKNSKTNKAIYDAKVNIRVYISSNRYYNYEANTGSNGQLKFSLDSYKPGTYKVEVRGADSKDFTVKKITSKFVVKKAPTKLTPKKLTAKKGAKKYFKVTVKNKKTKKVIKGVKVKIKVYTGKKYKTYTVKTNSKGIAQINVKSLKVGTHKVVVTSANKYCVAKTAKSTIKITKK